MSYQLIIRQGIYFLSFIIIIIIIILFYGLLISLSKQEGCDSTWNKWKEKKFKIYYIENVKKKPLYKKILYTY